MSTSGFHAIVIGAGTGGLCLAEGLERAGISVAVYERDRTRRDGLQGDARDEGSVLGGPRGPQARGPTVRGGPQRVREPDDAAPDPVDRVEDIVHFDKVFTRFEQHGDGTVTAFFTDGTSATGDVLVAADGANSRVRSQYLPHARLVDTGLIGITGKTPLTEETRALLPRPSAGCPRT